MTNGRCGWIIIRGHEFDFTESEAQYIDSFLNQVSVFVAGVAKFHCWNTDEENASTGVAVARGLEPGIVGVPIDLFFQRVENAQPRIRG